MATGDAAGGERRAERGAAFERDVAFERAVRREQNAITVHEQSAQHHDRVAQTLRARAGLAVDPGVRAMLMEQAEVVRARAEAARQRAEDVRTRLRREGIPLSRPTPEQAQGSEAIRPPPSSREGRTKVDAPGDPGSRTLG